MVYDSEDDEEAKLVGEGLAIHHFGIEVDNRQGFIEKIEANGGVLLSKPDSSTVKFRSPDGTIAEIVDVGRYQKIKRRAELGPGHSHRWRAERFYVGCRMQDSFGLGL